MRLVVWQRSANGAIPENTGAEWYSAHKARIRKGYFQKAIRVHTGRDSGAEPAAARPSRDKNAAEARTCWMKSWAENQSSYPFFEGGRP